MRNGKRENGDGSTEHYASEESWKNNSAVAQINELESVHVL